MPKKENKPGFTDELISKIFQFAAHFVSNERIEKILGLESGSIEKQAKKADSFARELEFAPLKMDLEVEAAIYKRSVGYFTTEEHKVYTAVYKDDSEEPVMKLKEIKYVKKFVPPDASSALIWLYNRRGERWMRNPNNSPGLSVEQYLEEKEKAAEQARQNM